MNNITPHHVAMDPSGARGYYITDSTGTYYFDYKGKCSTKTRSSDYWWKYAEEARLALKGMLSSNHYFVNFSHSEQCYAVFKGNYVDLVLKLRLRTNHIHMIKDITEEEFNRLAKCIDVLV